MRVVLTGGGTAGHLTPFAPMIEALRAAAASQSIELELLFMGTVTASTQTFFSAYDVPVVNIPAGKLRRYVSSLTIIDVFFRIPVGVVMALVRLFFIMPDVVISKGGYASVPIVLAAAFYRIPILLHESDAVPGLATRRLAPLAAAIGVGFPATRDALPRWAHKIFVVGIPTRRELMLVTPQEARQAFKLSTTERVLLVMGGSQGAAQINEVLLQVLPSLLTDMAIIHITGEAHREKISAVATGLIAASPRRAFYQPYGYLTDTLVHALVAADVVVARAGATTLAELAILHKPALLLPLPAAASDHQRKNALLFEQAGAARILEPNNVNPALFAHTIQQLMNDPAALTSMSAAMAQLATPQAAAEMAALTLKLASGFGPMRS